jgi:hypothetical protein
MGLVRPMLFNLNYSLLYFPFVTVQNKNTIGTNSYSRTTRPQFQHSHRYPCYTGTSTGTLEHSDSDALGHCSKSSNPPRDRARQPGRLTGERGWVRRSTTPKGKESESREEDSNEERVTAAKGKRAVWGVHINGGWRFFYGKQREFGITGVDQKSFPGRKSHEKMLHPRTEVLSVCTPCYLLLTCTIIRWGVDALRPYTGSYRKEGPGQWVLRCVRPLVVLLRSGSESEEAWAEIETRPTNNQLHLTMLSNLRAISVAAWRTGRGISVASRDYFFLFLFFFSFSSRPRGAARS